MSKLQDILLSMIPSDGSTIGNIRLRSLLSKTLRRDLSEAEYSTSRDALVKAGVVLKGQGRGGSIRLAASTHGQFPSVKADTAESMATSVAAAPMKRKRVAAKSAKRKKAKQAQKNSQVLSYRHKDRRKNNPEVDMAKPQNDPAQPKTEWGYDPHIDPALQFDVGRGEMEKLIDDALASGDQQRMKDALLELKRMSQPYLNWAGKAEHTSFEVDTVSLHVHERIDPATLLAAVRNAAGEGKKKKKPGPFQPGLFDAPFEQVPLRDAIDFYRHDRGWANRLIAGDSLLVMNSLLKKEGMAGQVQMVFMDPPYGIKYGSNFQPFVGKRDVKDGKDEDLTQEPEMIKAFRDTWELGIHSYLTYLRDRLLLAKELLHESGSVFLQISDDNIHLARNILDEIFGADQFVGLVSFATTSGFADTKGLSRMGDYILWYAKSRGSAKIHTLFAEQDIKVGSLAANWLILPSGQYRGVTKREAAGEVAVPPRAKLYTPDNLQSQGAAKDPQPFMHEGTTYEPGQSNHWKANYPVGLQRLAKSGRIHVARSSIRYRRSADDFPLKARGNIWTDTLTGSFTDAKKYVVQTNPTVIERCLLLVTDPGDLVLDPTCGGGTTAFVAEHWGRRWITCDTSRVALTLAKQRLATATYVYFRLRYPHEGLKAGFQLTSVPHIKLRSIVNNPEIDQIYDRMHPIAEAALSDLNAALRNEPPIEDFLVTKGGRKGRKLNFGTGDTLFEWEVPFDLPTEWTEEIMLGSGRDAAFQAFHNARQAMQRQMDASIKTHAEQQILYHKPEPDPNRIRITGPFTVEAVPFPSVLSLDEAQAPAEADVTVARSGESARQHQWRDELLKTGIRGKGRQMLNFASLEAMPGTRYVHVTGTLTSGERTVVSFGPEHAALEQRQVSLALNEVEKLRPQPKFIIFAAFTFDPEAAKDIDETNWPGLTLLKAQMNTDLLTEDLKKGRRNNQSFWLMGQPEVEVRKLKGGKYEVEVHGFDYFDTKEGKLISGGKAKIATWMLDTDYDNRSLFPRQIFFPMAGRKDGWNKLRRDLRAKLDQEQLAAFHGTVSLPFEAGENQQVAIKIVDDRGIESLKVLQLD